MSMRERMLALIQGREMDRVPFVMYDILVPPDQVFSHMGSGSIGLMRWCPIWRVEHPHCHFAVEERWEDGMRWQRTTLHTPAGTLDEVKAFESVHNSGSIRKHYVQEARDYEVLWFYLQDSVILDNYARFHQDQAELGENGFPLAHVERTPWQQLWVQWVGLEHLAYHVADYPDRVAHTIDLLEQRARRIFAIAYRSPAPLIDFPDNITAPAIGPERFRRHALPLYDELAGMLAERNVPVFVHMDGRLKPLWNDIAGSQVGGLDSFTPRPDCDTTVAEAVGLWPDKRLWVHFPSSMQLHTPDEVRATAEAILAAGGHTGRMQLQISEDVPPHVWRTTFPIIAEAVERFGPP
jgi:hypothetical protein